MITTHSLSVLIPVYNEEENLPETLAAITGELEQLTADWEIVVVESGSTDGSLRIAEEAAARDPRVCYLHQERREGMGSALRAGYALCTKDWICHLEADMPFEPRFVSAAAEYFDDYDFICGIRASWEDNELMWCYSRDSYLETVLRGTYHFGYKMFLNLLFGLYVNDINYSFKLLRRSVLSRLDLRCRGWFIDTELVFELVKAKARIKTMPVKYRMRQRGDSKVHLLAPLPIMADAVRYRLTRWRRP
jgi:dolichol-phosphate mannosyltransferase